MASRRVAVALTLLLQVVWSGAHSQFSSHVRVSTPARTYSHGVGDPLPSLPSLPSRPSRQHHGTYRHFRILNQPSPRPGQGFGYPKEQPAVPFYQEDIPSGNTLAFFNWNIDGAVESAPTIPVLPPSPYHVNSPNPESLWPEGLFIPPRAPLKFNLHPHLGLRYDQFPEATTDERVEDPYLLEGSEAVAAIHKIERHGELFFHEIPHAESLLANQQLRIQNNLHPINIGSLRKKYLNYRP